MGQYRSKRLLKSHVFATGYVVGVRSGVKTGGGIQFKIKNVETKYHLLMPKFVKCEDIVKAMLSEINGIAFPVVYQKDNATNAEILLFRSQYERFARKVPVDLEEVVSTLSACEE